MVCVPSQGIFTDTLNTLAEKNGSMTLASYVGLNAIGKVSETYPNQALLVQAFSRGSAVVDSLVFWLPPEIRHKITVHTFGATRFIKNNMGFRDTLNYVSWKDPVTIPEYAISHFEHSSSHVQLRSKLCEYQGIQSSLPVKIQYIETNGIPLLDHSFDEGYLQAREDSKRTFLFKTPVQIECVIS